MPVKIVSSGRRWTRKNGIELLALMLPWEKSAASSSGRSTWGRGAVVVIAYLPGKAVRHGAHRGSGTTPP